MSIISVNCDNMENNPQCAHGPTLKFSRLVKGKVKSFYACSACRDRKDCPFFLWDNEKITSSKQLVLDDWRHKVFPQFEPDTVYERFQKFFKLTSKKHFCMSCFDFVFSCEYSKHKDHSLQIVNNSMLRSPTNILPPMTKNKNHAQYWFSNKSSQFIIDNLILNKYSKILCIGTPTLYEILKYKNVDCLLLDIDHRYHWFYCHDEFIWFNMFNYHFFGDKSRSLKILETFIKDASIAITIDPPFGARLEPLQKTLSKFQQLGASEIHVMLVLPYFMEPQVLKIFPGFQMLDFPIEYTNHRKFKEKNDDNLLKKGSPVRIFTDITPKKFVFPDNEGYHYCKDCAAWRSEFNVHCAACHTCPSKNGDKYTHCSVCKKCVKQTWKHCMLCKTCNLPDHSCNQSSNMRKSNHKKKKR